MSKLNDQPLLLDLDALNVVGNEALIVNRNDGHAAGSWGSRDASQHRVVNAKVDERERSRRPGGNGRRDECGQDTEAEDASLPHCGRPLSER